MFTISTSQHIVKCCFVVWNSSVGFVFVLLWVGLNERIFTLLTMENMDQEICVTILTIWMNYNNQDNVGNKQDSTTCGSKLWVDQFKNLSSFDGKWNFSLRVIQVLWNRKEPVRKFQTLQFLVLYKFFGFCVIISMKSVVYYSYVLLTFFQYFTSSWIGLSLSSLFFWGDLICDQFLWSL